MENTSVPENTAVPDSQGATCPSGRGGGESSRRPRARNWNIQEMLCLAQGKQLEQERDFQNAGQNRFLTNNQKWKLVSDHMIARGFTDRTTEVCSIKWNNLFGDYKAIQDYHKSSGSGKYFGLTKNEKLAAKLVTSFSKQLFDYMDTFCLQRPFMGPTSFQDSGGGGLPRSSFGPSATPTRSSPVPSVGTELPTGGTVATPQMLQAADSDTLTRQSSTSEQTMESEERPPGDRAPGSTGRAKRKRNTVDVAGVLRSSHEGLILSLEKMATQRALMFDQQVKLEKERLELDKLKEDARAKEVAALAKERKMEIVALAEERRLEREAVAQDRRSLVSAFSDFAKAVNSVAARRPS